MTQSGHWRGGPPLPSSWFEPLRCPLPNRGAGYQAAGICQFDTREVAHANPNWDRHHLASCDSNCLRRRRADHEQPDSRTHCEARNCGRGRGTGAPARHPRDSPRRSGREAGRLGAGQLRAGPSRRPPLRQRLARFPVPDRFEQSAARVRESGGDVSACGLQPAVRADSSRSSFIRSSRETACSTPCTRSTGRAIRRSPTSFRPATG